MGRNFICSSYLDVEVAKLTEAFPRASSVGLALIIWRTLWCRLVHAGSVEGEATSTVQAQKLLDRQVVPFATRRTSPLVP